MHWSYPLVTEHCNMWSQWQNNACSEDHDMLNAHSLCEDLLNVRWNLVLIVFFCNSDMYSGTYLLSVCFSWREQYTVIYITCWKGKPEEYWPFIFKENVLLTNLTRVSILEGIFKRATVRYEWFRRKAIPHPTFEGGLEKWWRSASCFWPFLRAQGVQWKHAGSGM